MKWSLFALLIGFIIDLIIGDPYCIPHPVILIGKAISHFEHFFRRIFPKSPRGEKFAGGFIWVLTAGLSFVLPALILWVCHAISPWLRLCIESLMCWQILAVKSLRSESMKVFYALESGDLQGARFAVSMIVGRDTAFLDHAGITRAAVETVAENTADGVVAPMFFLVLGGAPLGFFYKSVNTMDSMLGYVDPPYQNIGFVPAKMDDLMNFIPARFSALLMLFSGFILKFNIKNGWKIFIRDRFNHSSPNSAQTESVCAGLLGIQLAGDACYHGILHKKKTIGDALRPIENADIPRSCQILYCTSFLALIIFGVLKAFFLF